MGMRQLVGGPLDGDLRHCEVPLGGDYGGLHLYFGYSVECKQWLPYTSDTPYWKPHKIARYNCDPTQSQGVFEDRVFTFKRFEYIDRTVLPGGSNASQTKEHRR